MDSLTAADIMARSEATLSPDSDSYEALARLLKSRLTGAPVVDDDGTLLGMLTERDCLKVLVGGALDGLPSGKVSDYMTTPAQSITPAATLFDIAHIFLTRSFRKLPVVDRDGRGRRQLRSPLPRGDGDHLSLADRRKAPHLQSREPQEGQPPPSLAAGQFRRPQSGQGRRPPPTQTGPRSLPTGRQLRLRPRQSGRVRPCEPNLRRQRFGRQDVSGAGRSRMSGRVLLT